MAVSSIQLGILVGSGLAAASSTLAESLAAVEVSCETDAPSTARLSFNAGRVGNAGDYALLSGGSLQPMGRLALVVTVSSAASVLFDGFITHQQLVPGRYPKGSTLIVTAEDVSVKMGLLQVSAEYPAMTDDQIVQQILSSRYGGLVTPNVTAPSINPTPGLYVPQQNDTDLSYIRELAARYGFIFWIQPGPSAGSNQAYWGPPVRSGTPQPTLNVDVGPATNVDAIRFRFDALAPTVSYGEVLQIESQDPSQNGPVQVVIASSTRSPALATTPGLVAPDGLTSNPTSFDPTSVRSRGTLIQAPGLSPMQGQAVAQGIVDRSTDQVVVGEGDLDVLRYGGLLQPSGTVGVRGTGTTYDGLYCVQSVRHRIHLQLGRWNYKQSFVIAREGVGSTVTSLAS